MHVIENVLQNTARFPRVVLTIGSFDGVHLGHQRILSELVRIAREIEGTAAVMTMRPHPRELFSPAHAPNLLTSERKKLELIEKADVDVVFILPFSEEVANLDRHEFVEKIIHDRCLAKEIVVGHDFRFGKNGLGDYHYLLETGTAFGHRVSQVPPFIIDGERVSSTVIRERVLQGDLEEAEVLLGRKYSVVGEVGTGRGIGIKLGFPTANIKPHHTAMPAQGVYAAVVIVGGKSFPAAVNIGIAPTIAHEDTVIEAFLLDFDGDIRGQQIEIIFHKRLRPEKKFPSYEVLIKAIQEDVDQIKRYFNSPPGTNQDI